METLYLWGQKKLGEPAWSLGEWDAAMHEEKALDGIKGEYAAMWLTTSKKQSPLRCPEVIKEKVK